MDRDLGNHVLLKVRGLTTRFCTYEGEFNAVNGVNLDIRKNESVALVGETGCGKSVTALSILRLIQDPPGKIISGSIVFQGEDLVTKSLEEIRKVRGKKIAMIFQKPMSSLNPTFKIGTQMADIMSLHQKIRKKEAWVKSVDLLKNVRIANPESIVNRYPHELSGGMRQRVMIAIALSSNPDLLIADEPTTALDATIQKQILSLIGDLRKEFGFSMLFISHNLRAVYNICERIYVMYGGDIVECGNTENIFGHAAHPYFEALMNSLPKFSVERNFLAEITGILPSPIHPPTGCKFHPRCAWAFERCITENPTLCEIGQDHSVACFRAMTVRKHG
jgi:oligopeptide/dipeptide ABC transporter ATP-binding protein